MTIIILFTAGYSQCNVDNSLEDAVRWISGTLGTDEENRETLVSYLTAAYPASSIDYATKISSWLITEVYMTKIVEDQGEVPAEIQQTPAEYLQALVYKLQGVDTESMTSFDLVELYCR